MATYAKIKDGIVENIVIADSEWVSYQDDSLSYVEYTEDNPAHVGGPYANGYFYPAQPWPSWTMNDKGGWEPPVPMPEEGVWSWDEDSSSWFEHNLDDII